MTAVPFKNYMQPFVVSPILRTDSYKQWHFMMYPEEMTRLYSNMTPRSFKHLKTSRAVWFGLQAYIKDYLIRDWNVNFFQRPLTDILTEYKRFHKNFSGVPDIDVDHIVALHKLGYLPLEIKALPEGAKVKEKVPFYTIQNTVDGFGWLVNFLETPMSNSIWEMTTIATIGYQYRQILDGWAIKTTGSTEGVQWQGHDFSMRGKSSAESSYNQAAWLLSFTGTDTIPAVLFLEHFYNADMEKELIGSSIPASEHSVMTSFGKENEIDAFKRLLSQFPNGMFSAVSDSFDLWSVLTSFMPTLKDTIMKRDGRLVIRPDSGDPVDIICGTIPGNIPTFKHRNRIDDSVLLENDYFKIKDKLYRPLRKQINERFEEYGTEQTTLWEAGIENFYEEVVLENSPSEKGVIELLWDVFGGTINDLGFKVLDPHVGAIYGDSITKERANEICQRLHDKGFASTNIVFGVGSYTMQMNTRDSLGIAVKSTHCTLDKKYTNEEVLEVIAEEDGYHENGSGYAMVLAEKKGFVWSESKGYWTRDSDEPISREIFKDPITDDGIKKSGKGFFRVDLGTDKEYVLVDQVSAEEEKKGELKTVFRDGMLHKDWTLAEIRERLYPTV